MISRALCFVLMPFGEKKDPRTGLTVDFDRIYEIGIRPAIEDAGLEPVRADEERTGGIIHKPMFERLMLCEFAVADLTTANANVFYELGVRHAVRPASTLPIFAAGQAPAFDVNYLRALPYRLGRGNAFGSEEASSLRGALAERLRILREEMGTSAPIDSPIFQLLDGYRAPDIARLKTDVFRERIQYSADVKQSLARARRSGDVDRLREIEAGLDLGEVEAGIVIDLFLSYRAVQSWADMIRLVDQMPRVLRDTVLVQEQYGLALNRNNERDRALEVLQAVIQQQGPSSETLGLIGRIHKDRWAEALDAGNGAAASGHLRQAIQAYTSGFESDWRDAYPGVNAVTLLEIQGDVASLEAKNRLLPVVKFAVEQRLRSSTPDYWDHATRLELAVLGHDSDEASRSLSDALVQVREAWEPVTTANNLTMIEHARAERGEDTSWLVSIIAQLKPST